MSERDERECTAIPPIGPLPGESSRPFWSVMMPTYNGSDHFELALRSVLEQDPGDDRMQIGVVDDCSTNGRVQEIVGRLAPARVEFHRQSRNVGLCRNWNTCVRLSRGLWVHLLHQDDLVMPGFYETLERSVRDRPEVGAAFCRHAYINELGERTALSEPEADRPGVLENWLEKIAVGQRIECPSIVVRRETYETLGGFTPALYFALDWEMWVRIAAHFPVWYEPGVLACFRRHDASETRRVDRAGIDLPDITAALDLILQHVPRHRRDALRREAERQMSWRWTRECQRLMEARRYASALAHAWHSCRHEALLVRGGTMFSYAKWAIKMAVTSPITRTP